MIQMTIFMLWGGLEALRLMNAQKTILGALLLAFIINVKLLPLVLIPYLLYRRRFKEVVYTITFSIVLLILPTLLLGWHENVFLLEGWFAVINPLNEVHLLEVDLGPHSLTALIPTLFTETDGVLTYNRNIMSLTQDSAIRLMNFTRLGLIVLTLYFLKWPPFKIVTNKVIDLYVVSYLFLLIPLIFPHQQKYAFFCIVPVIFYLSVYLIQIWYIFERNPIKKFVLLFLSLSFVLMVLTTDGIVGRSLNEIFQHYKLITYGALLLIPALMLARPSDLATAKK